MFADSGRCALDVLQLSVQQEGEADMDVELMRKGLLAVKLKGEEEGRSRGKKSRGGKGGGAGGSVSADAEEEEEEGLTMPGELVFDGGEPCDVEKLTNLEKRGRSYTHQSIHPVG